MSSQARYFLLAFCEYHVLCCYSFYIFSYYINIAPQIYSSNCRGCRLLFCLHVHVCMHLDCILVLCFIIINIIVFYALSYYRLKLSLILHLTPQKLIFSQFSFIGLIPSASSIMPAICYTYYKLVQPSTLCSHHITACCASVGTHGTINTSQTRISSLYNTPS